MNTKIKTLSRNELRIISAGNLNPEKWKCCWDHDPGNCSECVDYCSGEDCDCVTGSSPIAC